MKVCEAGFSLLPGLDGRGEGRWESGQDLKVSRKGWGINKSRGRRQDLVKEKASAGGKKEFE
jgi:hypothetical protein